MENPEFFQESRFSAASLLKPPARHILRISFLRKAVTIAASCSGSGGGTGVNANTMGVECGLLEKSGSWFIYKGDRIGQGRESAKAYLKTNKAVTAEIEADLRGRKRLSWKSTCGRSKRCASWGPPPFFRKTEALRAFYRYLRLEGKTSKDPTSNFRAPKLPRKVPRFLDRRDMEKLLGYPAGDAFTSHLVQGGADLRSVQAMLGHASLNTTQIYAHVDKGDVKCAHDKFHPDKQFPGRGLPYAVLPGAQDEDR